MDSCVLYFSYTRIRSVYSFKFLSYVKYVFADDNTTEKLISTWEQDSQAAIDWFKINEMIVNPDKFQAIVVKVACRVQIWKKIVTSLVAVLLKMFMYILYITKKPLI